MWLVVLAFLAGALFSVLLARGGSRTLQISRPGDAGSWMVYISVAADLTGDGLMVGAGAAVQSELGLLLAASQSVANIPGGFAAMATLRHAGVPRWRRVAMMAFLLLPVLASAALGYFLLRGATAFVQDAALAFIVGVLLLATVEDVLPQGDKPEPPRWISTSSFAGGFAAMALLSAYVY
jgi:ZIP family zinc transporter